MWTFFYISLDLDTGTYKPFMKDNVVPTYVNIKSNHPPLVLKNIPLGVNKRLNRISSNKELFDAEVKPYQVVAIVMSWNMRLRTSPEPERKAEGSMVLGTIHLIL